MGVEDQGEKRGGRTRAFGTPEPALPSDSAHGAPPAAAAAPSVAPAGTGAPASAGPSAPTQIAAPATPADPLVGQTLAGRYQIERKLGEGGMGSVYLGLHVALEKRVALKVLHGEFVRKPDLIERFLQEAKAASKIRHDNVIDITDFGQTEDGLVFFAMELLDGRDLAEELGHARLNGEHLPWVRTRHIFLQICSALSAAHDKGIIHRDLKPENIYLIERLGQSDFVKLLDFGIAKLTEVNDEGRKLTKTGMLFGTPEYMSPEQARGEKVDQRVDIYAMGCILFQMITGHVPFEADNFMGILTMHLTEETPLMGAALGAAGAPPALEQIVQRALAKDKADRYDSVAAMVSDILTLDDGLGDSFEPAPRAVSQADSAAHVAPSGPARTQWTGSVKLHVDAGETSSVPAISDGGGAGKWIALAVVGALAIGGGVFAMSRGGSDGGKPAAAAEQPASDPGADTPTDVAAGTPSDPGESQVHAAPRVTVVVTSQPSGAEIVDANGDVVGQTGTPFQLDKSDTPTVLTVRLDGYKDRKFAITPDKDLARDFELEKERRRRGDRKGDKGDKRDESDTASKADSKATTDAKPDTQGGNNSGLKTWNEVEAERKEKPGADQ